MRLSSKIKKTWRDFLLWLADKHMHQYQIEIMHRGKLIYSSDLTKCMCFTDIFGGRHVINAEETKVIFTHRTAHR